jgi:uncharacterized protein (DUF1697 family)
VTNRRAKREAAYVAFLRGINVGGHRRVGMDALKEAFASLGFENVQTLLASGNVLFRAPRTKASLLAGQIQDGLKETLGLEIGVLIRSIKELQSLHRSHPFRGIKVAPRTRFFVTFCPDEPASRLKLPYTSSDGSFRLMRASNGEVCSVLTITDLRRGMQFMAFLDKEFGRSVTTRSWNTITRIMQASG